MIKYLLLWLPMLVIAIGNGALRELLIKKYVNDHTAHQISTVTLLLLFALYIFMIIKKFPPASSSQALLIGFTWLLLTLVFEFGFGLAGGNPFQSLLGEYNLFKGKLWILVPLWVTIAPWLFFQCQN